MKKWMLIALIGTCAAGLVAAETNNVPWFKKIFNKSADETAPAVEPAPEVAAPAVTPEMPHTQRPNLTPEQIEKMKARRAQMQQREGEGDRPHQMMNPQQMEKMKAMHEELMKLGEAARNEADPAKKEVLVGQLRAKLTEVADKMLMEQKKRLEQAEKELPKLRERLAASEQNKSARIEDQIKRILAGEPLMPFDGKQKGKPGEGKAKKGPKPPVEE